MKIKQFLLTAAVAVVGMTAGAQNLATGEWAYQLDGTPAKAGQATTDHLFVREVYTDQGLTIDDKVTFDQGDTKVVWLWLDDDEIYSNAKVQALTPVPYNLAGDLYNEITYNSFQCDLYLPENMTLLSMEDEETGDELACAPGDRLPRSSQFYYEQYGTKTIDGKKYKAYKLLCANTQNYGCHFSATTAGAYKAKGALKKDDAPLLGLYLHCDGASTYIGEMPNMIIANLEFGFREAFTAIPQWDPNDYRFVYGRGGDNKTQRFQYYHRVRLFGNGSYELTEAPTISYSVSASSVTIKATGKGDVTLMIDGDRVDNPYTIERGEKSVTVLATATAHEQGKELSDVASMSILVPAMPGTSSDNVLTVSAPVLAETGKDFDLPVALENGTPISALQCDVYLPDGFSLQQEGASLVAERAAQSHSISVRPIEGGLYRVLIASPQSEVFVGSEGNLFVLHLHVDEQTPEGDYNVMLGNIVLADAGADTYFAPDVDATVMVKNYARGDANGDGSVNVGDYVTAANYIMELNPDPFVFSAADVDQNGTIDVGDLVGIINIVLGDNTMYAGSQEQEAEIEMWGNLAISEDMQSASFKINMENNIPVTAWQMDITMPPGWKLVNAQVDSRTRSHVLTINDLGGDKYRLLGYSTVNDNIAVGEGSVLRLETQCDTTSWPMMLVDNIVVAESNMTTHAVHRFLVGGGFVSVDEMTSHARVYAQGDNIVVETPVDTPVEIIMTNGMCRTLQAQAGTNVYPASKGIHIVRVAGQVTKLKI